MTKYTKHQYKKDVAANEAAVAAVAALLASYQAKLDATGILEEVQGAWNAAYDRQYELEQERHAIEMRFLKRNWTWQDHSFAELVAQNID